MNRREFLTSLFVGAVATYAASGQIDKLELLLDQTKNLTDDEFVTYVTFTVNMWVYNPAHCAMISGIGTDEIL